VKSFLECSFHFVFFICSARIPYPWFFHAFVSFFSAHTLSHPISWCNNAIRATPRRAASRRHYPRKLKWRVCVGHRRWVISTNVIRDLHGGGICETAITIIGDLQRAYDDDSPRTSLIYFDNTSSIECYQLYWFSHVFPIGIFAITRFSHGKNGFFCWSI